MPNCALCTPQVNVSGCRMKKKIPGMKMKKESTHPRVHIVTSLTVAFLNYDWLNSYCQLYTPRVFERLFF